jgi:hypothetical protein
MKFIGLKDTQKLYVITIMEKFNHDSDEITLKQMDQYHMKMFKQREKGGIKLGYPKWLVNPGNKLAKSVYGFPMPTEDELDDFKEGKSFRVIDVSEFSDMFKATVQEYGLRVADNVDMRFKYKLKNAKIVY